MKKQLTRAQAKKRLSEIQTKLILVWSNYPEAFGTPKTSSKYFADVNIMIERAKSKL